MGNLILKIRISVLWLFMAVAMSAWMVLYLFESGVIEQIISGEWQISAGTGAFLALALFWLVPLTMAFLSVTLKDFANRRANIILGIVFTGLNILHFIEGLMTVPSVHMILIVGSTVVVAVLIVWYAWKWPKQEA